MKKTLLKTKKIISLFFTFLMILTTVSLPAINSYAGGGIDDVIRYNDWQFFFLEDGTIDIEGYSGDLREITIPNNILGYKVTSIGTMDASFADFYNLTSITIPESVTKIGVDGYAYPDLSRYVMIAKS